MSKSDNVIHPQPSPVEKNPMEMNILQEYTIHTVYTYHITLYTL